MIEEFIEKILSEKIKVIDTKVKNHGTSGAIYVPKEYINKKVIVFLKENENQG